MVEHVAYVPRPELTDGDWLDRGFHLDPEREIYDALRSSAEFAPRPQLEDDPSRKQLIPYIVVRGAEEGTIFTMRRREAQTESRLHEKLSIGAGGHISRSVESDAPDPIRAGMHRELHEELVVPEDLQPTYRGLLNDDSNEVGRVHLGVVYGAEVPESDVSVRETEKMLGEWWSLEELRESAERLETWSQLLLEPLGRDAL